MADVTGIENIEEEKKSVNEILKKVAQESNKIEYIYAT